MGHRRSLLVQGPFPLLLLAVSVACAPLSTSGGVRSESVPQGRTTAEDVALFAATVRAVAREAGDDIRVDPRPLGQDPSIGLFVHPEDFAIGMDSVTRARAVALARLGIEQFHRSPGDRCGSGPGGTPPAIEPGDTAALREWLFQRQLPVCVLVSLPREGGVYYPPAGVDRRAEPHPRGQRVVRVVTMGPGQAIDIFDVVARKDTRGKWKVQEVVRLSWLRS